MTPPALQELAGVQTQRDEAIQVFRAEVTGDLPHLPEAPSLVPVGCLALHVCLLSLWLLLLCLFQKFLLFQVIP